MIFRRAARSVVMFAMLAAALVPTAAAQPPPPGAALAKPKLTKPPKLVTFVEAPYPASERSSGKTATVVLEIAISDTGHVDTARVKESAGPAFDAAAVEAVQKFVFEPAEIDNRPATIRILYRYEFVWKQEVPTTAIFEGVVRARDGHTPLASATVELGTGEKTTTDEHGVFHFDAVPAGKAAVTISASSVVPIRTEETFEPGKRFDATYEVDVQTPAAPGAPADDMEIVVTAPKLVKQVVSTSVGAEEGRRIPGAQGDVIKVVENMPGVARAPVGSGQLVVWGAAPEDTRVYIDDVHVPVLFHNGGIRSVVNSDFVKSVELAPGGYGAAYGRGIGGLVTVELNPLRTDGFHGSVDVDLLDASAMVRGNVGEKVRAAVAFRQGWLDALVPLVTSKDVGALFPIPRYYDGQARVGWFFSSTESIELGGMLSSDAIDHTVPSLDPSQRRSETEAVAFNRVYLRYRKDLEGGGAVTVTPSIGTDAHDLASRFGTTPTELKVDSDVFGLRALYHGKIAENIVATVGLDAEVVSSAVHHAGSVNAPPREGDIRVFGQPPSDQIDSDDFDVVIGSIAPFGELDIGLFDDRLHIIPGLRLDPFFVSTSRRTPVVGDTPSIGAFNQDPDVDPRIALRFSPNQALSLKAAYGVYHQAPSPEDLSAVFGNPLLHTSTADQYLVGAAAKLPASFAVETTGFYSASRQLVARSPVPSPLLAQALLQQGSGRAYGVQLLVRKELSHGFFGWLSYSMIRSERQDRTGGDWRLFDFDQTHVLTALASYELGWGVEVGARFRFATGYPRTPVIGSYFDARTGTYQPLFGAQNSIRIPAFAQLDVRIAKKFKLGPTEVEAYLDVQNVTDRANPEEIVYSHDYTSHGYITGLPILPVLGVRCAW